MELRISDHDSIPRFFGRTLYDDERQAMFFNWTGAGFAFAFKGTRIEIEVTAFSDDYPGEGVNLPWLAVSQDGSAQPDQLVELKAGMNRYLLFESEETQTHLLFIVKRSENSKGRVCLHRICVEGEVLPYDPPSPRYRLEFIGDSITCGFGNEAAEFSTETENGLAAYPEIAARLLDAEYHSVCISGIPLCWASDPSFRMKLPSFPEFEPPVRSMENYYAYADRYHEEAEGITNSFTAWNFDRFRPDAIVVNLGTNDAFRIRVSGNDKAEETHFGKRYQAFLHMLRKLNGSKPVIACTLGSMDYYLYDTIISAVTAYQKESGDKRIFCMKYGAIDPWGEGMGALGHPNTITQERMGHELAGALRNWLAPL